MQQPNKIPELWIRWKRSLIRLILNIQNFSRDFQTSKNIRYVQVIGKENQIYRGVIQFFKVFVSIKTQFPNYVIAKFDTQLFQQTDYFF